jgi:hypothetical protein
VIDSYSLNRQGLVDAVVRHVTERADERVSEQEGLLHAIGGEGVAHLRQSLCRQGARKQQRDYNSRRAAAGGPLAAC